MESKRKVVGTCPICSRALVEGPSADWHHLIPKTYKGTEKVLIHRICHTKIHSLFTEKELFQQYNTVERLRDHPEMEKFVHWLRNKDPEFKVRNATPKRRQKR